MLIPICLWMMDLVSQKWNVQIPSLVMLTRILLSEEFDPDPCCEKNSNSNFKVCLVSKKKIPILVINMKICWNRSQVKKILNRSFKKELVNHVACPVPLQNKNSFLSSQIYTRENTFHTHDATHGKSTKNNSTRRKWKGNERAEWNAVEYETCLHTQPTQMSAPQQKTPEYENEITKNLLLTYL